MDSYGYTMPAASRMSGHGISFIIYSFLMQSRLSTFHNSRWWGRTAGAAVHQFGSGAQPSAHICSKRLKNPVTKWTFWRWDNTRACRDHVNCSNPQKNSSGKVERTSEHFSWYGSDDFRATIEPSSFRQYKLGNFLAIRTQNWHEIIDEDDDDENWVDPGGPSSGRSCPGDDNDNDEGAGDEDMQSVEEGTGKGKRTKDGQGKGKATEAGKGKGKGKMNGHGNGKLMVKQTPEGDDFSRAVALQLQRKCQRQTWTWRAN